MENSGNGCSGCGQPVEVIRTMNIQENSGRASGCTGCSAGRFSGKLGTCKACIASNIIGAIICWTLFALFSIFYPLQNAMYGSLVFSAFFTLLLMAHGIAYYYKKEKRD